MLRGQYPVLRTGELTTLLTDDANKVYAYSRTVGTSDLAVVVLNRDSAAHSVSVGGVGTSGERRGTLALTARRSTTS